MKASWAGLTACLLALAPLGCTVGEGEGRVSSDHIWVAGCWNGAFDLNPDFFGVNPDPGESLTIRVQRGDNIEDVSDGLIVLVNDLPEVRTMLGQKLDVGMPRGVTPSGVPFKPIEEQPDPPKVSLVLYLHNSCHLQNGTIYSTSGWINFSSLFSGDPNESSSEARLTDATFDAYFADPRELVETDDPDSVTSRVTGNFHFFFQRGQPSQPFQ